MNTETLDNVKKEFRIAEPDVIEFSISERDGIKGFIRNGEEGVIKKIEVDAHPVRKGSEVDHYEDKQIEILRFHGSIDRAIKIDGITPGLKYTVNDVSYATDIKDAKNFFRETFSLTPSKTQMLMEVLTAYVYVYIANGDYESYYTSPIAVVDEHVTVKYPERHDVKNILSALRQFLPMASHPVAFASVLSFCLIAPLHETFKVKSKRLIQTPLGILTGKTHGGKTALETLYIGKGYDLDKGEYFYPYNRIYTRFTLMLKLKHSNLPAVFDDLPPEWILHNKEDLKSYVQTGHVGDRGNTNKTETEYKGKRSFLITINADFRPDDDLAMSARLLILRFTAEHTRRSNKDSFDKMFDALPEGFMYSLFATLFEGKDINEILHDVEKFNSVDDWINYGIDCINKLCHQYDVKPFPAFHSSKTSDFSNAYEIAQGFLEEWGRINMNTDSVSQSTGEIIRKVGYRSNMEGSFKVEIDKGRYFIHFTPGAFNTLVHKIGMRIYSNTTNFLNNIDSSDNDVRVEFEGKPHSVRIEQIPLKVYTISMPTVSESL